MSSQHHALSRSLFAAALLAWGPAAPAAPPRRPTVDFSAMKEAMGSSAEASPFPSAASYAHFLRARLAHHDGAHREALDELRLALASDEYNPYLMTELAEQYARISELDRAENQLKKVIERFPDYAPAQLLMGRVLYEAQKTTRARAFLARAIKLRPNDPDAYLVLTQLWLDQGRVEDAVRVVEDLGAAVPGEPIGFRRLGLALAERGDAPRAEKLLLRAVERDPGDLESWATLARIYEATNRLPKALESYEKALERDPENREVLLSAGRLALRMKRQADARAWFDQILSLGRDPEVTVKVAFSYLAAHQLPAAVEVLDQSRAGGQEPRLHFYAGLVHERLRSFQKAADAFGAVPRETGELFFEARLHRAMCLSSLGQARQALDAFRKLAEEKPELGGLDAAWARAQERAGQSREAEVTLARAFSRGASPELLEAITSFYERQGRINDAVSLYSGAVARAPREEAVLFALGVALDKKGEWQKGVERMKKVLEVNPQNAAAMNFIGYTLADRNGDLEEAERFARKALEARPDSPAFLDTLGWVLFRKGDHAAAIEMLERAVDGAPDEPTLLEHLGDAYLKLGKRPRAQEAWAHALEVVSQSPDASERPSQRADLERKLKMLTGGASGK